MAVTLRVNSTSATASATPTVNQPDAPAAHSRTTERARKAPKPNTTLGTAPNPWHARAATSTQRREGATASVPASAASRTTGTTIAVMNTDQARARWLGPDANAPNEPKDGPEPGGRIAARPTTRTRPAPKTATDQGDAEQHPTTDPRRQAEAAAVASGQEAGPRITSAGREQRRQRRHEQQQRVRRGCSQVSLARHRLVQSGGNDPEAPAHHERVGQVRHRVGEDQQDDAEQRDANPRPRDDPQPLHGAMPSPAAAPITSR